MKNSPGSMIGGIGLTTWVRDVQFSRTIAITSSTSASSTPSRIVAFDCLRNPPELCSRVARNSLSSRASTRAPASSVWTIGDDELHRAEYPWRSPPVNGSPATATVEARFARCTMRPPTSDPRAGVDPWPATDRPAILVPACLPRSRPPPRGNDLDAALRGLLAVGAEALGADDGRGLRRRSRTGPTLTLVAADGMSEPAQAGSRLEAEDATHPFAEAASGRTATFDREADHARRQDHRSAPTCRCS